jgi:hypothetical protein
MPRGTKAEDNPEEMRYVSGIPRKALPTGRVLVHNHVIPQSCLGMNGFRAWTQKRTSRLELCSCDWAGVDLRGLKHYRIKCSIICSVPKAIKVRPHYIREASVEAS